MNETKDGRMVGLLDRGGSWFCAIPNQCLRLLYVSKESSVFPLVTRRISAAVYRVIIIIVCHTKSHSIPSDIAHRFNGLMLCRIRIHHH